MQASMQMLHNGWVEPIGWALIVTGLALATWTLRESNRPRRALALGQLWRGAKPQPLASPDLDRQWQQLAHIIESDILRAETLPSLQARALEAVEAADDTMSRLLAELTPSEAEAPSKESEIAPTPAPAPRRLAA
jgi:hypothetical protein